MTRLPLVIVILIVIPSARASEPFAPTLSESHLFTSLSPLTGSPELIPYTLNFSFWSDGAEKQRWFRLPANSKIHYDPHDQWSFLTGTLFVKHFEQPAGHPIETRLLLLTGTNVSGASYRWRADQRDADLLATNALDADHNWYFPSREDCRVCHTQNAGLVLGLNTRQLNRALVNSAKNQIANWAELGLFENPPTEPDLENSDHLAIDSLQATARAYLDVNCSICHRPGGTVSYFDARYSSPLERLIDAPVLFNQGIDNARVISPRDPWRSILLLRFQTLDGLRMPPLAHQRVDTNALALFANWINSLPGPEVTPPPTIDPPGGRFERLAKVTLSHADPNAVIRYTTNGAAPGKNSRIYTGPITLTEPATVRARAYGKDKTRSITVQETYLVQP